MTESQGVLNQTTGERIARRVVRCDTFFSRGRGLMFRDNMSEDEVYLFVLARESVMDASIHMFFVTFPIAVIWLDNEKKVVDSVMAEPWRPFYAPRKPARYFIEGPLKLLEKVHAGDELVF